MLLGKTGQLEARRGVGLGQAGDVLVPHLELAGADVGEEGVGEVGLGGNGEDEGLDEPFAEGALDPGGKVGADAGGVDDGAAAAPPLKNGDEGVALLVEGAAGPPRG